MKKYKTHFEANYKDESESYVKQSVKREQEREQEIERKHKELETKILLFTFILSTTLTFCLVKLLK